MATSPSTRRVIRIRTLGAPACLVHDVEIADLPTQKARFAVLTYLAVERNVSRDDLAAMFWPESDDERARHALSQAIYELKRSLGDGWLETHSGRLVATPVLTCDAQEFQKLCDAGDYHAAVQFYHGPFLGGFFLSNSKGFETWCDRQRSHHERLHRKAYRELVNQLVEAKKLPAAIDTARQWVTLDPLEDEANHRFIELLALAGNRADALREFAAYERRLNDELQVQPLDQTRELVAQLRADGGNSHPELTKPTPLEPSRFVPVKFRNSKPIGYVSAAAAILLGGFLWLAAKASLTPFSAHAPLVDSTRIAVLPFYYAPNVKVRLNEGYLIQDALAHWRDLSSVDLFDLRAAIQAHGAITDPQDASEVARTVRARWYIRGDVAEFGGSLRIHAALYDVLDPGQPIIDRSKHVPLSLRGLDSAIGSLVNTLLFQAEEDFLSDTVVGTKSWIAQKALIQGLQSVRDWQLESADTAFQRAASLDQDFAQAFLWLAQVRFWSAYDASRWRFAAEHALTDSTNLTSGERGQARALVDLANDRPTDACARFRS